MLNTYSSIIHKTRYAKFLDNERRREHWNETVKRYVSYMTNHISENLKIDITKDLEETLKNYILNLKVMPSMRAVMTSGKALERDNVCAYNCAYLPIDDVKAFDEAMFILLCGTGVGFSVERQYINQLPEIPDKIFDSDTTIVVKDSKEGWAKAYRQLIALLYSGEIAKWDLSKLRPAGARLKTFGGRSAGPEPLNDLFKFTVRIFKNAQGRKLTSLECHDIMCKIGEVVVVGGVRRSAMISLSNLSDDRMRHAKAGAWWEQNVQRALSNNSAVYTERPEVGAFMQEWLSLYESKSGERGIFNREACAAIVNKFGRRDANHEFGCNPCLSGDTMVAVADGRNAVSIEQLALEGKKFPVYSAKMINHKNQYGSSKFRTWKPEIKNAIAFKSGTKKIIKLMLSNGSCFECTPDHRIAMADGTYLEAKDCLEQSLVKFFTTNRKYRTINSYSNGFNRQYRMIWEYHNGKKPYDYHIDHIINDAGDFIENLQLLSQQEHDAKSAEEKKGENNPIHRVRDYEKFCRNQSKAQLRKYYRNIQENESIEYYDDHLSEELIVVDIIDENKTVDVYDLTVDDNHNFYIITKGDENYNLSEGLLVHNCSEIILRPYQFCNLTEVIIRANDTFDDIIEKIKIATILGTIQSTLTHFPYLRKIWKKNTEEERLLGVSLTGIYDNKLLNDHNDPELARRLNKMRETAVETNKEWSNKFNIQTSTAITCIKPSGTISELCDTASGIHPRHAGHYIRRIRADNKDPVTDFLKQCNVPNEPDVTKPQTTTVFSFVKSAPVGAKLRDDVSSIDHLNLWLMYQRNWCEHKPSVTISVKEQDWPAVGAWVWENFDEMTGVSFLPYDGGTYRQAPYESITEEEYNEWLTKIPSTIDWSLLEENEDLTEGAQNLACVAGGCSL